MKNLDDQDECNETERSLEELKLAARSVHAAVDAVDIAISTELGIHRSDLRCLNLLEYGPLKASEIGRRTGLSSGSVTALIDRLERAGFVERRRSKIDRRSVEVNIPATSYPRIASLYQEVGDAVTKHFGSLEADRLTAAIEALVGVAEAYRMAITRLPSPDTMDIDNS